MIILGTCVVAQDKMRCLMNNMPIEYDIDSTDSEAFIIKIKGNPCSLIVFNIPSKYYHESDSIIIKMKKKRSYDSSNKIKATYCYSIGMHNIALYLSPDLFSVSASEKYNLIYSIELFYPDEKKYWKITNQLFH